MIFFQKKFLLLNGILLAVLLTHSIIRDVRYDNGYPGDLRNRVVGARLQKDGKLPYHFHWQETDGIRYYDPEEILSAPDNKIQNDSTKIVYSSADDVNKITASPFFHELLYPVCDLPQRVLSRLWLLGEYIILFCMTFMICGLTIDKGKKWLIVNTAILFTVTEAWKSCIAAGQLYLFEGFLICCILTLMIKNKKYGVILAGVLAAAFVLTRPIAMVLFIPFLPYYKKYKVFMGTAFAGLAIYAFFILIDPGETALYKDYWSAMKTQVKLHQRTNEISPPAHISEHFKFSNIEGYDMAEVIKTNKKFPYDIYSENGNIFVVYYKIIHKKLDLKWLGAASVFTVLSLSFLFFLTKRKHDSTTSQLVLFGFSLYMIVELFSPVYRHQYNTVQWFPLVLTSILLITEWRDILLKIMIIGLILNICNFTWLPMRHTIGEYAWLTGLLLAAFSSRNKQKITNRNQWKQRLLWEPGLQA
jgi:Glycosyltransferase family 87